mgnify:CR=1 FL=1
MFSLAVICLLVRTGNSAEDTCFECREVLGQYKDLVGEYESCIQKSGEQVAQIGTLQGLIVSGLQNEIASLRREYRTVSDKFKIHESFQI